MEILGKKIDDGMGFIILFVLMALIVGIFGFAYRMIGQTSNNLNSQANMVNDQIWENYENKLNSGDSVRNCIKQMKTANPNKVKIVVLTNPNGTNYNAAIYGWMNSTRTDNAASYTYSTGNTTNRFYGQSASTTLNYGLSVFENATSNFKDYSSFTVDGIDVTDPLSPFYISSASSFMGSVIRNNGDIVHTVIFVQQP